MNNFSFFVFNNLIYKFLIVLTIIYFLIYKYWFRLKNVI